MPFEGEVATYIAVSRIAESEKVKGFLRNCLVTNPVMEGSENSLPPFTPFGKKELPRFVVAIDGSYMPVSVRNGFPGAEVGFVSVALVLLDLKRIIELSDQRFPNPAEVERTTSTDAGEFVLPGSNVQLTDALDPPQSFRKQLYEALSALRSVEDGESLLDTYHALLAYKAHDGGEKCPYEDCPKTGQLLDKGIRTYDCSCPFRRPLYATDALRIHEAFAPSRSSGEAYGETMQVVERLLLLNLLRTLERKNWLNSLARIAFVIDGPLAVFGHPAWLKDSIQKEIGRINSQAKKLTGKDLLIVGIEKTGTFVEHLVRLDTTNQGSPGNIAPGTTYLITDSYIKRHIILSTSEKPYGSQTYFGRKFFYKTQSGARIVGMTPYLRDTDSDLSLAEPDQYPRLTDALGLLDALVSSRYPDAVVPIVEAHAQAAIARGVGIQILERLVRELLIEQP